MTRRNGQVPYLAAQAGGLKATVVGAGPAGLAAAVALRGAGRVTVYERADAVGASWRDRYDALRLNSSRRRSSLPWLPIEGRGPRWLPRDDYVRYLTQYARHWRLDVRTGTEVRDIDAAGARWVVATSAGYVGSDLVVVATGWDNAPSLPSWPGADTFPGELLHAAAYRSSARFAGRNVLVVGSGTSAGEIAMDLVRGGAQVALSGRTPPTILPRQWHGIPLSAFAGMIASLPVPVADALGAGAQRVCNGRREGYQLPPAAEGIATALATRRRPPMVVDGLVEALRCGRVRALPAVEGFTGPDVVLADGSRVRPDAVIAATGYRRNLEPLVGHLGVLDPQGEPVTTDGLSAKGLPGLYFVGFGAPLSGQLGLISHHARQLRRLLGLGRPTAEAVPSRTDPARTEFPATNPPMTEPRSEGAIHDQPAPRGARLGDPGGGVRRHRRRPGAPARAAHH